MKKHSTFNIQHSTSNALRVGMFVVMAMVVRCSLNSFSQSTNAPTKLTYDSFRTVSDRNIFNPNRYARGSGRPTTRATTTPASRVESFSLVGIIAYDKGVFAFFDGTKSDYKQALQVDGKIGEYKVATVSSEQVVISEGTNNIALKVGMQMRREDEGDWFLSEGGDSTRKRIVSSRSRTRTTTHAGDHTTGTNGEEMTNEPEVIVVDSESLTEETTNGEAVAAPSEDGITDPVLLRLMQRRQQMNQ